MRVLGREAVATSWANKVPSVLVLLLVAVMVAATLTTVGRTAAAEQQLAQRLDDAGSRILSITDSRARGLIPSSIVAEAGALSVTERAVGTTTATDVVAGPVGRGASRVPAWGIVGDIEDVVTLTAGRKPELGEALVSASAMEVLGFDAPYGWTLDAAVGNASEYPIVGEFTPKPPFKQYGEGVVYLAGDVNSSTLQVLIHESSQAVAAQQAVLGLIAPTDITDLQISSPIGIAELRHQVMGDLGSFGKGLLLGVLAGGALLVAIVVLADVLVRRKDLGRRRALGASRGVIVALVTMRTLFPALVGAAIGIACGSGVASWMGAVPPGDFVIAVAVLAILVAVGSAVPPAVFAATRDPVAVLRTP